jgi:hypothetical protein
MLKVPNSEIAVVEHQHEQAVLAADALDRMAVPAREVPDVARAEIDDLGMALRIDGGDAALAADHVGPFRRVGVPVQFAHRAGSKRHQHAGELLRHRELHHRRLLGPAAVPRLRRDGAEPEAERRQLGAGEHRRRRPERRLPALGRCLGGGREHAAGGSGTQHMAAGDFGHR